MPGGIVPVILQLEITNLVNDLKTERFWGRVVWRERDEREISETNPFRLHDM